MRLGTLLPAVALLLSPLAVHAAPVPAPAKGKPVDLVLCLDTSNSMDGLIDSAKRKLWAIVNDLAKIEPAPTLRVALYSYGNNNYDPKAGWVRKDLDLTGDLDEVYKRLFALTTLGGEEYVARVTRDALADLKWADDKDALRLIFVCGNEPVDQDKEVGLDSVAGQAKAKGVVINTIYCGPANHPETTGWRTFAEQAGGKYANIDQDRAKSSAAMKTPYDEEIQKLSAAINTTYCWYGRGGREAAANQVAQDKNAEKTAGDVATERGLTKASKLYKNATCDLIDRIEIDKDFDLSKIKEEDLPDELKKLKADERMPYLKKKAEERADIQKKVAELNVKRTRFIEDEKKKEPKSAADKAFDDALKTILRDQAAAKGMTVKE
jgi:hypothetical protein